jgi:hypothetical protein
MCICIYVYIYIYIYMCICVSMYMRMHIHTYLHLHIHSRRVIHLLHSNGTRDYHIIYHLAVGGSDVCLTWTSPDAIAKVVDDKHWFVRKGARFSGNKRTVAFVMFGPDQTGAISSLSVSCIRKQSGYIRERVSITYRTDRK